MKCLTNQTLIGIKSDCNPSLAGIAEAFVGYFGDFTVSADTTTHSIASIAVSPSSATGKFYAYEFAKQTGSLTSTLTKDETTGTRYYTNEIVLQFSKLEASKHLEFQALAAEKLVLIVKDNNQKYWYCGFDSYVSATEGSAATGQSYDDGSLYNISMSQMSAYLPFEIEYSKFSSLIDSGSTQSNG